MAIVSYDEICLADKSTVHKLVVIDILSYQIQIEIRVFAKNVPRTGITFINISAATGNDICFLLLVSEEDNCQAQLTDLSYYFCMKMIGST